MRVLTGSDIAAVLTLEDCIEAVERAFKDHAEGRLPAPASLGVHASNGTFHVKAAMGEVFVAKVNANFPGNPAAHALPTIQGVIVVMDRERGTPLALLDSAVITTLRTAAATAVAAKYLALPNASTLAVIGCGTQGRATIDALRAVRPVTSVRLWDLDTRALEACARSVAEAGLYAVAAGSVDQAVAGCEMVVTCTTAREPILEGRHARPGLFIAAVGADNPEKSEIAPALMAAAKVVPDLAAQAATQGDLHHAINAGALRVEDIHGELGAIVAGRVAGRRATDEMFVFDSTGTAIQDVVTATIALMRAGTRGTGVNIAMTDL